MVTDEQTRNDSQGENEAADGQPDTSEKSVSQVVPFG
jgi:hypothetical protein